MSDGFRAIVFRGEDDVYPQSRESRPIDRYFAELHDALLERLPPNCVVDGEIVIATERGLEVTTPYEFERIFSSGSSGS
jgi:ATP-dependent DNA ligase